MKTTTKPKTEPRPVTGRIDQFLGFQVRIHSLEFYRDEAKRQQAGGEEILAELARLQPTGDVLRDARLRAEWEEKLDEACDQFNAALDHLWWEMKPTGPL